MIEEENREMNGKSVIITPELRRDDDDEKKMMKNQVIIIYCKTASVDFS